MDIEKQIRRECEALSKYNRNFTHMQSLYIEARRAALDGTFKVLEEEYGTQEALEIISARKVSARKILPRDSTKSNNLLDWLYEKRNIQFQ